MEQPVQRSGMPRGCLIGLIIVGILALILLIVFGVICMNREKVLRWSMRQGVVFVKDAIGKQPVGIDTTRFNALADNFLLRLDTAQFADSQLMAIGPIFQQILEDKKIDSAEVVSLSGAMVTLFPDLSEYGIEPPPTEMPVITDTVLSAPVDSGMPEEKQVVDTMSGD
jgi:energy-converting hydrogenase Eha subunit A